MSTENPEIGLKGISLGAERGKKKDCADGMTVEMEEIKVRWQARCVSDAMQLK